MTGMDDETEGGNNNRDDWNGDETEVKITETEVGAEAEMREVEI